MFRETVHNLFSLFPVTFRAYRSYSVTAGLLNITVVVVDPVYKSDKAS
jgi:hypothetical protein